MEFNLAHVKDIVIVSLKGSLVSESAANLKKIFDDCLLANKLRIIVDLKNVDFVDTTALAILVTRSLDYRKRGGCLYFAGVNDSIRNILENLCLLSFFRIFSDVDEAYKSF